jgi:hypothetical protein
MWIKFDANNSISGAIDTKLKGDLQDAGPGLQPHGVTLREMLQWMIRSQAPAAPPRGATGKVQRLDGGGRGTET